jgi:hypothetical protein
MKKTIVERMYTAKVAELLNQGWHIHTSTMPGHQGEIAHVDLTDGSEIRRALLCREMTWGRSDADFYGHKIIILVGKNTDRIWPGWDSTLWNTHIEVCSQIELAEIQEPDRYHPEGWYTDMATAQDIQRIRNERREARRIPTERVLGTAFKSIALRWVRKQPRMKTTKLEDITKVARYTNRDGSTGFKIEAKGKTFTLHS